MAALRLRPVKHAKGDANRFCGPSVISSLTGMNTGEAARLLRAITGRPAIKGASTHSVRDALYRCGVRCIVRERLGDITLAQWLRETHGKRGGRVFLIVAGNHFQAVSGNTFVCGRVGKPVGLTAKGVKRRAVVAEVLELEARKGVTIPKEARKPVPSAQAKRAASSRSSARAKARKLAAEIGVEIEQHTDLESRPWFVSHPDLEDEADPHEGDHYCYDWAEVLDRVQSYAEHLQAKAA